MRYEEPKVSILVPCFNVEKFLPQCLDSLVNQTLKEIQIICINDGSTDSTLQIIESYAALDDRIEIIDKPNSGYGASMNCGLDTARGEYVGIVESDDFADKHMFKKLYSFASKHACDLVKSNYNEYAAGRKIRQNPFRGYPYKRVFNPAEHLEILNVLPIIWTGLYRRRMLAEYSIRFNETPGASYQDTSFVQRVWFASDRVALLPNHFLNYRIDNVASSVKSQAKVFAVCEEFVVSERFLAQHPSKEAIFAPALNAVRFATYKWNYNRIAPEFRLDFTLRWAQEIQTAQDAGLLDLALMSRIDQDLCPELLADPQSFCETHPELLPW